MHYCDTNFRTKRALKDAVKARLDYLKTPTGRVVNPVTVHNPETFGGELPTPENGTVAVGGPHFPEPHKWYAKVTIKDGEIVKAS